MSFLAWTSRVAAFLPWGFDSLTGSDTQLPADHATASNITCDILFTSAREGGAEPRDNERLRELARADA